VTEHSWHPIDLAEVKAVKARRPAMCGSLFTPVARHLLSAPPEEGKSLLALAACAVEIHAGNAVVWIDRESDPTFIVERLRCYGITGELLTRFIYIQPIEPVTKPGVAETIAELLEARKPTLATFDAFAGLLDLHDLDGNKAADVERGYRLIIDPWRARGGATNVIDHVVKARNDRGKYATGSERKLGAVDVHIGLELDEPFGRGRCGRAKIIVHKDRFGFMPRPRFGDFVLESDEDGLLTACRIEPSGDEPFRPTVLMERVSEFLQEQTEAVTRTTIREERLGKSSRSVQLAIDCLVEEGYASETAGPRGAKLIGHIKPFPDPFPPSRTARNGSEVPTRDDLFPVPGVYTPERERLARTRPVPLIGEPDFLPALRLRRQHLTDKEWRQRRGLHKLVERARAAA
jgi:hypothetical protein